VLATIAATYIVSAPAFLRMLTFFFFGIVSSPTQVRQGAKRLVGVVSAQQRGLFIC
jgi:hypothetical protein